VLLGPYSAYSISVADRRNKAMKPHPTIFLSGVAAEFRTFLSAVEAELQLKGCSVVNQPGFPQEFQTVSDVGHRTLNEADAMIQLVGFRFGPEPSRRLPGAPCHSFVQMEFEIARRLKKPIYVFLSANSDVRDAPAPEDHFYDIGRASSQIAHRDYVQKTAVIGGFFKDQAELCKLVAALPFIGASSQDKSRALPEAKHDVFISAKSSDYPSARQVFEFLRLQNVRAFLSSESLPLLGNSDYSKVIDTALESARHMIVVTSTKENVESSWVEMEWRFFINEKRSGRKQGNLVTVIAGGLLAEALPPSLRYYECIRLDNAGLQTLLAYVRP